MALQYLDAEAIPYFVVKRSSGGDYEGSWSSAYSMKFQGDYAVLIGHNNAEMGLKVKFDEIDWAACLPLPDPMPTDAEGYMKYLSTLFTGQMGTLVPPVTSNYMIIVSQASALSLNAKGEYVGSPAGSAVLGATVTERAVSVGERTLKGFIVSVTASAADKDITIQVITIDKLGSETIIHTVTVAAGGTGVISSTIADIKISENDRIAIKCNVPSGTGDVLVSGTTLVLE